MQFFFNQHSLKLHLPSCRWTLLAADNTHPHTKHHPLRSSMYLHNSSRDYNDCDDNNSDITDAFPAEAGDCLDNYNTTVDQYLNDYKYAQEQPLQLYQSCKSS